MDHETALLWKRYVALEAERCAIASGVSKAPDADARSKNIQREQAQLKDAIGEPLFSELVEAEL